ncbi:hypothetical protein BT69DRAFT_1277565 [Atractiella rhizophila]|nr:hypothetical protein BT69DRAFT_1277565 [Atractiella rhizophila]
MDISLGEDFQYLQPSIHSIPFVNSPAFNESLRFPSFLDDDAIDTESNCSYREVHHEEDSKHPCRKRKTNYGAHRRPPSTVLPEGTHERKGPTEGELNGSHATTFDLVTWPKPGNNAEPRTLFFFEGVDGPVCHDYFQLKAKGNILEASVFFDTRTYNVVHNSDGKEILPSLKSKPHIWLQAQKCASPCSWRFKGKQDSEIFDHVLTCKFRNTNDPLNKLCTVWKAQRIRS